MASGSSSGVDARSPGYHPGLDGLRALCLLGVLLFHSDFAWMSGGFLGVSTFFTLSGFLITSLLVAQWRHSGRVSMAAFWERRLRRLAPAAILAVGGVVASAPLWLPLAQQERLSGDALASLAYVVNWRLVRADYAYALIFSEPSPLQHFWSLAIEAQFYLVYPLLVGLFLRLGRGLSPLVAGLAFLGVASIALSFVLESAGVDRIYYGSDTRAAELLIGGLGALIAPRIPDAPLRWIAPVSLVAMISIWSGATIDDAWLYRGGFAAYGLLSLFVVIGATRPTLVRTWLEPSSLRWVGRVSYGGYVYHWPIFLIVSGARWGLSPWATFTLRVAATLLLAGVSSRWIEEPIRRARAVPGRSFWAATGASTAAVCLGAFALGPGGAEEGGTAAAPHGPDMVRASRWAVFGDSTALSLTPGLQRLAADSRAFRLVPGDTRLGCGLLGEGRFFSRGRWPKVDERCRDTPERWGRAAKRSRADVAIVLTGAWESRNWRLPGVEGDVSLGDPDLDSVVRNEVRAAMDRLTDAGVFVVWLTAPRLGVPDKAPLRNLEALSLAANPDRQDRMNEIIREAAKGRRDVVVVDLAEAVRTWPGGEFDPTLRPDLTHFGKAGAIRIARQFLGPQIVRVVPRP